MTLQWWIPEHWSCDKICPPSKRWSTIFTLGLMQRMKFVPYKIRRKTTAHNVLHETVTQEAQLSPTNRATHLCKYNGVADPMKTCPSPYVLLCRIRSFCVKGCRHKYRRTPKIGQPWNSTLLGWEASTTPRYNPSPTCVRRQFGVFYWL